MRFKKLIDDEIYTPISGNTFAAVKTTVGTTATLISMPENSEEFIIRHITQGVIIWIGENENISANGSTVFPLLEGDSLQVTMKTGDSNNLYAIVSSGTTDLYVAGVYNV